MIDLGGTWKAAVADEVLRRTFAERDADDAGWADIAVPGHWRRTPGFGDSDGPLLYRRQFEAGGPAAGERAWLVFDGLFYVGDVWLDGSYLGDTEGYFIRHTVTVLVDGTPSHQLERRIGLRSLAWHDWSLAVNGERLFLKGAVNGPTRLALADATADELRADVVAAHDAGLDLLRVHGHVSRPELYDAAHELGMLVWQDLPMRFGQARGLRKQAARQAAAAVDTLGHHPSVAIWCGHDSPIALDVDPGRRP